MLEYRESCARSNARGMRPDASAVAFTRRSVRILHGRVLPVAVSQNFGGAGGLGEYQASTFYLDGSATYALLRNFEAYVQASNITNERERYYLVWPSQFAATNHFETRVALGLRGRFCR